MWDWSYSFQIMPSLLSGLLVAVEITLIASLTSVILGMPLAMFSRVRSRWIRGSRRLLLEFVRGTPLLVQLYFAYFVLPSAGIVLSAFTTGWIVLGLQNSTYVSEVYRANIESLAKSQWEAAAALHLSHKRTWMVIVLPQSLRRSVPAITAYIIGMFKQTALLFAIGVPELLERAQADANVSYHFLEPYTLCGLLYLAVSYPAARGLRRLERRYI